jgi:hypothetical protein
MPDPLLLLEASAVAALLAAVLVLLCGRATRPAWLAAGGALGVGLGFFAGAWLVGGLPRWPPREDQDRLFLVLLPAAVVAAALARVPWLGWAARWLVAGGAAPVLLYGSVYLSDAAGPGSREWSVETACAILGGLAAALAAGWALLDTRALHRGGRAVLVALALASAATGATVLLSGYATGGQLGFPLAGALVGAALASFFLKGTPELRGSAGVGLVGLFALLAVGRFFGFLTTTNALLLFAAPLLGWLVEWPLARRVGPRLGGVAGVVLAALPVALALTLAVQTFQADSAAKSSTPGAREPSLEDYMDFGK